MTTLNRGWAGRLRLLLVAACAGLAACNDCDLSVSTSTLPDGVVGVPYMTDLDSDCGGDLWFTVDSLPPGITLEDDGDLRGVPSLAGLFTFTVGVYDFGSGQTAYGGLALRVTKAD